MANPTSTQPQNGMHAIAIEVAREATLAAVDDIAKASIAFESVVNKFL